MQETRNHIQNRIALALALEKGSLIDFETTGFPWDRNGDHEIVTLGYFSGNNVVITQRKTKDKLPYYVEISKIIAKLPRPFYAYNANFEKQMMQAELDMVLPEDGIIDIMKPWMDKAQSKGLKWPKLDELISEPEDYFKDRKVSGKDVPKFWRIYLKTGIESALLRIMEHCFSDILRESILMLRYQPRHVVRI